ncbi:hypothetical protein F5B21DRAFT_485569 [Xylaria acuta]|nr:hypothetical protein F5B21DRAFT_485569 [Xylaria acuta]
MFVRWSPITQGAMVVVGAADSAVFPLIERVGSGSHNGTLTVTCINSLQNITVSGDEDLIHSLQAFLEDEGTENSGCLSQSYQTIVGKPEPGKSPPCYASMISSVTDDIISQDQLQRSDYWAKNLVSQVRFSDAISVICDNSIMRRKTSWT